MAIDDVLRWSGRLRLIGRFVTPVLERWFRRFAVDVEDVQNRTFAPGSPFEYRMLQMWLRNALPLDVQRVRADIQWKREPSHLDSRGTRGLWLEGIGSDMANFSKGATEEIDLPSNGRVVHLGLLVRYPGDTQSYIVAPNSCQVFKDTRFWRVQGFALPPGHYTVVIDLKADGGLRATVRIRVVNPETGEVTWDVLTPQSLN
jgi:hypothetical protein